MPHLAPLLITSSLLLSTCVSVCSCRTTKGERQEQTQTLRTDTAHYAQITRNIRDSTATLTWLTIDTLDVWLSYPVRPDSATDSQHLTAGQAQTVGRPIRVQARRLRLARAETSSSQVRQDSTLARHQATSVTTSVTKEQQPTKTKSFFTSWTFISSIANLVLLAILYYLYKRYKKRTNS